MLRPDQESELHRYFSGALAAAMGIRSTMGGMIDHLKLERGGFDSAPSPDADDRVLEASWEFGRIDATLRKLSDGDRRVLRMVYEPLGTGESDRLETFGVNARIAVVIFGGDRARLVALCKRSKHAKDPGAKSEATAVLCGLVWQAAARVLVAQDAYGVAVENRKHERRPWYVQHLRPMWGAL